MGPLVKPTKSVAGFLSARYRLKRPQRLVDRIEAHTYHFVGQVGQTSKGEDTVDRSLRAELAGLIDLLGTAKLEAAWARVLLTDAALVSYIGATHAVPRDLSPHNVREFRDRNGECNEADG